MSSSNAYDWLDRPIQLDREDPYLRIQFVMIFVRDLDMSIRFYVDRLEFKLELDVRMPNGQRRVAVAPPDGTAMLSLVAPEPGSPDYRRVGQSIPMVFVTEDVNRKFKEWSARGVRFAHPPESPGWGLYTNFEDIDGNSFALLGFDDLTRAVEEKRQALAKKLETERRTAQELEIAKEVQARLFPQTRPNMRTLDYCGICIQARHVGGDYYDFLDLGKERLGLVVGDISGKGIAASLLMANLQANLRSRCAIARDQPREMARSVNQLFCENTGGRSFATLLFVEYDDQTRHIRYANCGHLPALLLHSDNTVEQLESTATVMGLFKEWDCVIAESQMYPGDVLALYSDGVTESFDRDEEDFGIDRLVAALRKHRDLTPQRLLSAILDEVREFGGTEQHDDVTLIIAKCIG